LARSPTAETRASAADPAGLDLRYPIDLNKISVYDGDRDFDPGSVKRITSAAVRVP
jgi:hypothetical protein